MAGRTRTPAPRPGFISADRFYSRHKFLIDAGINPTRLRELRLQGVVPKWLNIGRRQYLRGVDGIAFLEAAAELTAKAEA